MTHSPMALNHLAVVSNLSSQTSASSLHSDHSTPPSERSPTPFIGTLSGKAIQKLGEAELRALEWAWLKIRRAVIQKNFPHDDDKKINDALYDDLIGFARRGDNGPGTKHWALGTMRQQIQNNHTSALVAAINRMPNLDLQFQLLFDLCFWQRDVHASWHYDKEALRFAIPLLENIASKAHEDELCIVEEESDILKKIAHNSYALSRFTDACVLYKLAVADSEVLPEADSLRGLADSLRCCGQQEEAEMLYRDLLEQMQHVSPNVGNEELRAMSGLACSLTREERYEEAEALHRRVIQGYEDSEDVDEKYKLWSLFRLGDCLRRDERFKEAESTYERALPLLQEKFGENHEDAIWTIYGLAECLRGQRQFHRAIKQYLRALRAFEELGSEPNEDAIWTLSGLAECYRGVGWFDKAVDAYTRVLDQFRECHGLDHEDASWAKYGLAASLYGQGRWEDAEDAYCDSLICFREYFGEDHKGTVWSLIGLGEARKEQGEFEKAVDTYPTVGQIERAPGTDENDIISTLGGLEHGLGGL